MFKHECGLHLARVSYFQNVFTNHCQYQSLALIKSREMNVVIGKTTENISQVFREHSGWIRGKKKISPNGKFALILRYMQSKIFPWAYRKIHSYLWDVFVYTRRILLARVSYFWIRMGGSIESFACAIFAGTRTKAAGGFGRSVLLEVRTNT